MLGEIIKSTEALRYHAKTAEIAGQNLAHVNDQNYARQRVLSREGLMSKGQGGLNAASIEAGGLDHARNELLDKRVFAEFAETANLDTQKEILSLLQAALGESINRQALSGGLDGDHDSNLSAGGLARALDDLFNAFQELSASNPSNHSQLTSAYAAKFEELGASPASIRKTQNFKYQEPMGHCLFSQGGNYLDLKRF